MPSAGDGTASMMDAPAIAAAAAAGAAVWLWSWASFRFSEWS